MSEKLLTALFTLLFIVTAIVCFFMIPIVAPVNIVFYYVLWLLGGIFSILSVLCIAAHAYYDDIMKDK